VGNLFSSGRIVDGILALMAIEAIALILVRKVTNKGIATVDLLVNLAAGMALMLALRAALTGQGWQAVALCLIAALIAHLLDITRRWTAAQARP
jgi:hypothetical protein